MYNLIKEILSKEGYYIKDSNIKICEDETINMVDASRACKYIKSNLFIEDVIIFICSISNKDYLEQIEKVKIFDRDDLKELAIKYKEYSLSDLLK